MVEKILKPEYSVKNKNIYRKIKEKEKIMLSRRKFLGQLTATLIASGTFSWNFLNWLKDFLISKYQEETVDNKKDFLNEQKNQKRLENRKLDDKTETEKDEKESINNIEIKEDILSLEKIIKFDPNEKIILDKNAMDRLKKYWEEIYEGKMKKSLDKAWERMGFWEEAAFRNFLIPVKKYCQEKISEEDRDAFLINFKDFFYLSIPETHWNVWSESLFAKGPFQFTEKTGSKFNLKIETNYDERTDPEKSARAAAEYLLYLYENMNFDWNLVLSGYNGSFIWKYKKNRISMGKKLSYEDYLIYLTEKIEKIKEEALYDKNLKHKIKENDSWVKIAQKYGCEEVLLKEMNQTFLKKGLVKDQFLFLPINDEVRKRYFYNKISDFSENINYPAKFLAVIDVIKRRKEKQDLPKKENPPFFVIKKIIKQPVGYRKIKTQKGDSLEKIAFKYEVSVLEIKKNNKIKNEKILPKQLLIPEKKITLFSLAGGNKGLLEILHKLNPAIQNVRLPIPDGLEIKLLTHNNF